MRSLRGRIIAGGALWAAAVTALGVWGLTSVSTQIAEQRFDENLREQHTQVVVAFASIGAADLIESALPQPIYERVYSGRYWQVNGPDGITVTSPSMFDVEFVVPEAGGVWQGKGPVADVRAYSEQVLIDGQPWTVTVASSLDTLSHEIAAMRRSAFFAFGLVAVLSLVCAGALTSMLLRRLQSLSDEVLHRWDSGRELNPEDYPSEVAPLVSDINELILKNRSILDRGRRQAADLAHALKTPSAALRNELVVLSRSANGTAPLFEALDRIDAQIVRSLARMRASHAAQAVLVQSDVDDSFQRLARLFRASPDAEGKQFEVGAIGATVAVDQQDLEEMLGNLLENAFKWSASRVAMSAQTSGTAIRIEIDDDGPGIDAKMRASVLEEGARLDTSVPGTGLGLSIVNDLCLAYGGTFTLERSESLGGLRCVLLLPARTPRTVTSQALSA